MALVPRLVRYLGITLGVFTLVAVFVAALSVVWSCLHTASVDRTYRTVCISNEKQLGLAFAQYSADNDGKFPSGNSALNAGSQSNRKGQGWALQTFPYVKSWGVYDCPVDTNDVYYGDDGSEGQTPSVCSTNTLHAVSYAYNSNLASEGGRSVTQIMSPSTQIVLSETYDVCDTFTDKNPTYQSGASLDGAVYAWQNGHEIIAKSDHQRHQGGANYAMADGHVLWLRPNQVNTASGTHAGNCPAKACEGVYLHP